MVTHIEGLAFIGGSNPNKSSTGLTKYIQ